MPAAYSERLHVPLRWWVQATMFLATVWLAFIVALPAWLAWGGQLSHFATKEQRGEKPSVPPFTRCYPV